MREHAMHKLNHNKYVQCVHVTAVPKMQPIFDNISTFTFVTDSGIGIDTTKIRISIIITKWFNISVTNAINVAR